MITLEAAFLRGVSDILSTLIDIKAVDKMLENTCEYNKKQQTRRWD